LVHSLVAAAGLSTLGLFRCFPPMVVVDRRWMVGRWSMVDGRNAQCRWWSYVWDMGAWVMVMGGHGVSACSRAPVLRLTESRPRSSELGAQSRALSRSPPPMFLCLCFWVPRCISVSVCVLCAVCSAVCGVLLGPARGLCFMQRYRLRLSAMVGSCQYGTVSTFSGPFG